MARIPPIAKTDAPAPIATLLERAEQELPLFRNQIATLAYLPGLAGRFLDLYLAFPQESQLPRHLVELAILTVSHLHACRYCVVHHTVLGTWHGLRPEQIQVLQQGDWATSPLFDATEKLVITYAEQVTRDANRVSDTLFQQLCEHFSAAQIVELTLRITLCGFYNKFNQALQIDIEPEAVQALGAVSGKKKAEQ
ncbi:MAG: carboxymuconolactone decarboxylase family protein [Nitrospinota bacterium]|nr:MAG: carboxymuconolactone decarboxylase family protein [Nitrospinota bacterium]